jgi:hypothetical protein
MGRRRKTGQTSDLEMAITDTIPYKEFTECTFVEGITLTRYMLDVEKSKTLDVGYEWYWVYYLPITYLEIHCDACVKAHNPKNLRCSATKHRESPYDVMDALYDFKTGKLMHHGIPIAVNGMETIKSVIMKTTE